MFIIGVVSSVTATVNAVGIPRYRLTNAASQLTWTFQGLRMPAIGQHHAVKVTFTNNHVACRLDGPQ